MNDAARKEIQRSKGAHRAAFLTLYIINLSVFSAFT